LQAVASHTPPTNVHTHTLASCKIILRSEEIRAWPSQRKRRTAADPGREKKREREREGHVRFAGLLLLLFFCLVFGLPVSDHVFYLATNKHLKYETQGEVVSLA